MENERSTCDDLMNKLKCDELKNNLLFFKIQHSSTENEADCRGAVVDILQTKMGIDNAGERMQIQVERLGNYRAGVTRPILVRFDKFEDKEHVRRSCPKLKDTAIGMSPHLPKEIMDKHKPLMAEFKKAKRDKKRAFFRYDKLIIDGEEFIPQPTNLSSH
ncbi:uncharacterized protein LOC128241162 [Mya arenaria]|uniref:uncharacterized protein LOC128241162 n=1 Tax=Mya arenaria TaxID=6604 RepID=UPI0022E91F20|nr:uncharacterized protein LOC128241162 [Mya arenaria]